MLRLLLLLILWVAAGIMAIRLLSWTGRKSGDDLEAWSKVDIVIAILLIIMCGPFLLIGAIRDLCKNLYKLI